MFLTLTNSSNYRVLAPFILSILQRCELRGRLKLRTSRVETDFLTIATICQTPTMCQVLVAWPKYIDSFYSKPLRSHQPLFKYFHSWGMYHLSKIFHSSLGQFYCRKVLQYVKLNLASSLKSLKPALSSPP